MIAPGSTGKTVFLTAINDVCEGSHLPSGLFFGSDNPLATNQILEQQRRRKEELQNGGSPSTQDDYQIEYCLQEGEETRVKLVTNELIGQVLTGTTETSKPDQKQLYERYVSRMQSAHTLLPMVAPPVSDGDSHDDERFKEHLRLTNSYLRHALKLHDVSSPCSVAIVVSKIDMLFADEQQARAGLTDDILRRALGSLVRTVIESPKVREAVIIPISSFGFGRGEAIEPAQNSNGRGRPMQRLNAASMEPFNVVGLLSWVLLNSLLPQEVDSGEQETIIARVVRSLAEDVEALDPWRVPIKHRGQPVA